MICVLYLLHSKSMSIPVFKPFNNSFSYFSCKVTTGTYNLQSVMLNFKSDGVFIAVTAGARIFPSIGSFLSLNTFSPNTQFCDYFKINSISVLIIKKFKLKIKLLKFFNGLMVFFIFRNSTSLPTGKLSTNFVL